MKTDHRADPRFTKAVEGAEGVEIFEERPTVLADQRERDHAQGTGVYTNPDDVVPATHVRDGEPGRLDLSGALTEIEPEYDVEADSGLDF
jgi:hypothetical protein